THGWVCDTAPAGPGAHPDTTHRTSCRARSGYPGRPPAIRAGPPPLALSRSAEGAEEALPPAWEGGPPAQLAPRLPVGGPTLPGRHLRHRPPGDNPGDEGGDPQRTGSDERLGVRRQPVPDGSGVVVDDVVDALCRRFRRGH